MAASIDVPALDADTLDLVARAGRLEKYPLARLISLCETEGEEARLRKAALFRHLAAHRDDFPRAAHVVGVTGTPGAGKSTLIGRLGLELLQTDSDLRLAILAIDPTSPDSGGALLGDRVRTQFPVGEDRVFFRSQATQGDLGGLGRRTFAVTRLLRYFFDLVCIETVGIGQSELEIRHLADETVLVLQPLAGDHVQYMKAGVMEIPDVFVINKCDEERLARRSHHELTSALGLARVGTERGGRYTIFQTSAVTGRGIPELAAHLREAAQPEPSEPNLRAKELHFLRKTVRERYGEFGVETLEELLARHVPLPGETFEELEALALSTIAARVR